MRAGRAFAASGELARPADERVGRAEPNRAGKLEDKFRAVCVPRLPHQLRILVEDCPLERQKLDARLDAELFGEHGPGLPVDVERLRLTPRSVKRKHQLAAKALPERMLRDQRLQLSHQLLVAAECQIGVDPVEECREAELIQAFGFAERQTLQTHVGKRRAAPERQRLPQAPGRPFRRLVTRPCPGARTRRSRARTARPEPDTGPAGHEPIGSKKLAQRRHVALHQLGRARGRPLAPELVDQAVDGDGLVRVQQQHAKQAALLARAERYHPTLSWASNGPSTRNSITPNLLREPNDGNTVNAGGHASPPSTPHSLARLSPRIASSAEP